MVHCPEVQERNFPVHRLPTVSVSLCRGEALDAGVSVVVGLLRPPSFVGKTRSRHRKRGLGTVAASCFAHAIPVSQKDGAMVF
jgi:hypothetical protein